METPICCYFATMPEVPSASTPEGPANPHITQSRGGEPETTPPGASPMTKLTVWPCSKVQAVQAILTYQRERSLNLSYDGSSVAPRDMLSTRNKMSSLVVKRCLLLT